MGGVYSNIHFSVCAIKCAVDVKKSHGEDGDRGGGGVLLFVVG